MAEKLNTDVIMKNFAKLQDSEKSTLFEAEATLNRPCPWCGESIELEVDGSYFVRCQTCGACGPPGREGPAHACAMWQDYSKCKGEN